MKFLDQYKNQIHGVLSTFDRIIFKGHITSFFQPTGIYYFLSQSNILLKDFGNYAQTFTNKLKEHLDTLAKNSDSPVQYLSNSSESKEKVAKEIFESSAKKEGLICILKAVELCQSFDVKGNRKTQKLEVVKSPRKCLHYYLYFNDSEFGWMHVRIQSWLPFEIQIYLNGREYLKNKLSSLGIKYTSYENSITWVENVEKAQALV